MKHIITTLLLALCATFSAAAQTTATVGGINYEVNDDNTTCSVIKSPDAKGDVTIPASVTIGGKSYSVTTIGDEAFKFCKSLTGINLPNSVTAIGNEAFMGSDALTSINIPTGVTTIGYSAFWGCDALTSIDIPTGVTTIGNGAFGSCYDLTSINVANDNPAYCSVDGVLFSKDKKTLLQCPAGQQGNYTVPNGVTTIGEIAFSGCYALTSINIPTGVTTIGNYAFWSCSALTSINIPTGVTTIGDVAFIGCYTLTSISIPSSVTTIGNYAFSDCDDLANINCYAKTPPAISDDPAFLEGVTVHVPKGCAKAYRTAEFWKNCTIEDDL